MTGGSDTAIWITAGAVASIAMPVAGAVLLATRTVTSSPRAIAVASAVATLATSLVLAGIWGTGDGTAIARGPSLDGGNFFFVDGFSLAMLPYVTLVTVAILLVAPRRTLDDSAAVRALLGLAATLALFLSSHPVALVFLWIVTLLPVWQTTRDTPGGGPAARVFAIYMGLATACLVIGTTMLVADPPWERASGMVGTAGGWLVAVAVMIRKGIFPFHSWYPALFSGAPMSTALSATMPQVGSYTAVRLLVGHADGVAHELEMLSLFALVTAVYGAALAVVQRDLRGFIGVLAMSQSALVLVGLSGRIPMELNGAFCLWISSGLAITGIGLVSWAIESRAGAITLETLQGRFWDAPSLAAFFLLFGMATIGLPGTLSFVADDLIVSGSLDDHLGAGLMVIASTVLCGIAVMRCWFHVFGGHQPVDSPRHGILRREQASFTVLMAALFGLGLWPGPLVRALDRAAAGVLRGSGAGPVHGPDPPPPPSSGACVPQVQQPERPSP